MKRTSPALLRKMLAPRCHFIHRRGAAFVDGQAIPTLGCPNSRHEREIQHWMKETCIYTLARNQWKLSYKNLYVNSPREVTQGKFLPSEFTGEKRSTVVSRLVRILSFGFFWATSTCFICAHWKQTKRKKSFPKLPERMSSPRHLPPSFWICPSWLNAPQGSASLPVGRADRKTERSLYLCERGYGPRHDHFRPGWLSQIKHEKKNTHKQTGEQKWVGNVGNYVHCRKVHKT